MIKAVKEAGFAIDNLFFGSGGALLQKVNRDTLKCAFKCSEITLKNANGEEITRPVFKDPKGDTGKKSKKGRLTLERDAHGKLVTMVEGNGDPAKDVLKVVFKNGKLFNAEENTFAKIRERASLKEDDYKNYDVENHMPTKKDR